MNIQLTLNHEGHITILVERGNMMPNWVSGFSKEPDPSIVVLSTKGEIEEFIGLFSQEGGNQYNEKSSFSVSLGAAVRPITIDNPNHLKTLYSIIKDQAKYIIDSDKFEMDADEFKKLSDEAKKSIFKQFQDEYKKQYESEFFKNPFSSMKDSLGKKAINKIDQVEKYAKEHPNSRTAIVLNKLKK